MTDEARVADHIGLLSRLLEKQVAKARGWPASLTFPEPRDDDEREALSLFIRELQQATGAKINYATEPGRA